MVDFLTDWRGNKYYVGDRIVYPRASGRSVEMTEGIVTAIKERYERDWKSDDPKAMRPTGKFSVQVQPRLSSRFTRYGDKVVTIQNIENITLIPDHNRATVERQSVASLMMNKDGENDGRLLLEHVRKDHCKYRDWNNPFYRYNGQINKYEIDIDSLMNDHAKLHAENDTEIPHYHLD